MPLTILDATDQLLAQRGDVVVCVPVYNAYDEFVACIRSIVAHTPADVPLLVCDDASPDRRPRAFLEQMEKAGALPHRVFFARHEENCGFVRNVNDAFARVAPADVIVVNSDCVVTEGWFAGLVRAAATSTLVASVSALTNHGTILSLPYRNRPQPYVAQTTTVDRAARAIAETSLRLYPRIPTIIGHCFYLKRAALDLAGDFDLSFSPGYGEEVDFSQRCILRGLAHVVADDVFVLHKGSASFAVGGVVPPTQLEHDRVITARYPYYDAWVREVSADESGPFPRSLRAAQRALRGLTVTIDGRCLTPIPTGTQVATLELISALSQMAGTHVRVVMPSDLGAYAAAQLDGQEVERITVDDVARGVELSDIAHRPFQVSSAADLELLAGVGHRIVITHLDLIGFHNPGYFASFDSWSAHRRLTQHALGLADAVAFISRASADEAIAEDLVPRSRSHVVHLGTDHVVPAHADASAPAELATLGGRPFLFCIGTDFMHKNRVFALKLLLTLRERHDWDGGLVFAGPHVAAGASTAEEAAFLALNPQVAASVVDVAAVGEGQKSWLMRNATMVVYPSVHEGFGFIPFEAAEAGVATAFAAQTSIAELLPSSLALIEQWDAELTAERLIDYLRSPELRAEHVRAVNAAAAPLTWRRTTAQLLDVYARAASLPTREARRLSDAIQANRRKVELRAEELEADLLDARRIRARTVGPVDEIALSLLGEQGVPPDLRRPLLAITSRPWLSGPLFALIRSLYGVAYSVRHFGRSPR